ncbi:MAG: hypothetical protein ABS917_05725 [Solibacillus sp.]
MKNKIKRKVRLFFRGGLAFLLREMGADFIRTIERDIRTTAWVLENVLEILEQSADILEHLGNILENRQYIRTNKNILEHLKVY